MASILIGNPLASGPQLVISGHPWSGTPLPIGGIQFKLSKNASGYVFLGLSGNMTLTSGGMMLSGRGLADGVELAAGDSYFVPRAAFAQSGSFNVYARHEAACSGQARLFYEAF